MLIDYMALMPSDEIPVLCPNDLTRFQLTQCIKKQGNNHKQVRKNFPKCNFQKCTFELAESLGLYSKTAL